MTSLLRGAMSSAESWSLLLYESRLALPLVFTRLTSELPLSRIAWSTRASESWNWTMKAISPALTSPASIMPSMAATTRKRTEWNFALQPEGSKSADVTIPLPWPAGSRRRAS